MEATLLNSRMDYLHFWSRYTGVSAATMSVYTLPGTGGQGMSGEKWENRKRLVPTSC